MKTLKILIIAILLQLIFPVCVGTDTPNDDEYRNDIDDYRNDIDEREYYIDPVYGDQYYIEDGIVIFTEEYF